MKLQLLWIGLTALILLTLASLQINFLETWLIDKGVVVEALS